MDIEYVYSVLPLLRNRPQSRRVGVLLRQRKRAKELFWGATLLTVATVAYRHRSAQVVLATLPAVLLLGVARAVWTARIDGQLREALAEAAKGGESGVDFARLNSHSFIQ